VIFETEGEIEIGVTVKVTDDTLFVLVASVTVTVYEVVDAGVTNMETVVAEVDHL
jgi:hypothetical protein